MSSGCLTHLSIEGERSRLNCMFNLIRVWYKNDASISRFIVSCCPLKTPFLWSMSQSRSLLSTPKLLADKELYFNSKKLKTLEELKFFQDPKKQSPSGQVFEIGQSPEAELFSQDGQAAQTARASKAEFSQLPHYVLTRQRWWVNRRQRHICWSESLRFSWHFFLPNKSN